MRSYTLPYSIPCVSVVDNRRRQLMCDKPLWRQLARGEISLQEYDEQMGFKPERGK